MAPLTLRLKSLEDLDPWIIEQKAFDILNEFLQPNSTVSPKTTARAINELTPMKRRALQGNGEGERFIQFFEELNSLPPTTITTQDGYDIRFWTKLPSLDTSLREAWLEPVEQDDTLGPFYQWVNLNSFAARLLATGLVSWTHFAIWSLRAALENPPPKSRDFWGFRIYSSSKLFERLGDEDDEELLRVTATGPFYKGEPGLCPERWLFWKEKFRTIAQQVESKEVKDIAISAADKMDIKELYVR
ncbi:hypothetical protein V2W45_1518315 [Cenococcum geophilum]